MPDAIPILGLMASLSDRTAMTVTVSKQDLEEYIRTHYWDVVETATSFQFNFYKVPNA